MNAIAMHPSAEVSSLQAAFERSGIALPVPFMELSATVIRDLPLGHVAELKRFEVAAKSELATLSSLIQAGLDMRFGELAKAQLLEQGKDTGTTHVQDADFDVVVEIGADVSWDQADLQATWNRMVAAGQDPTEFITAKYSVSETRFKSWPEVFRQPFMAARTVKVKPAKFTLRKPSAGKGGH